MLSLNKMQKKSRWLLQRGRFWPWRLSKPFVIMSMHILQVQGNLRARKTDMGAGKNWLDNIAIFEIHQTQFWYWCKIVLSPENLLYINLSGWCRLEYFGLEFYQSQHVNTHSLGTRRSKRKSDSGVDQDVLGYIAKSCSLRESYLTAVVQCT